MSSSYSLRRNSTSIGISLSKDMIADVPSGSFPKPNGTNRPSDTFVKVLPFQISFAQDLFVILAQRLFRFAFHYTKWQ